MKKIVLVLGLLLFAVNLNAGGKLLFDLTAQHFSKAMAEKGSKDYGKEGRYELSNAYVTTDNRFNGYGYEGGVFSVKLKKPLPQNWKVIINTRHLSGCCSGKSNELIRISTNSGTSFVVSFIQKNITVNGKTFKVKIPDKITYDTIISSKDGIVTVYINGQEFYKTKTNPSDKLLITEVSSVDKDYLSRLEIFSVD